MSMIDRLVTLSGIWARENDRSLSRLATIVVNDGKLFERLANGGTCTVATYERLIAHLADPANWSGPLPADARTALGLSAIVAETCPTCKARADHPSVQTCGCADCPMRTLEAA